MLFKTGRRKFRFTAKILRSVLFGGTDIFVSNAKYRETSRKRRPHHRRQDLGLVLKLTADKDPEAITIVKIAGHGSLDMCC